jgi:uncharacterized protein (TIGR02757 family)
MTISEFENVKKLLDKKAYLYECPEFIENDPIQVPHKFTTKEDIEIAGFLTATIAWGQRISIIKSAKLLLSMLDNDPFSFISNAGDKEIKQFENYIYRTFRGDDCIFFLKSLRNIYLNEGGLEKVFTVGYNQKKSIYSALVHFHESFLMAPHLHRSEKHVPNVITKTAAKRLNLFLRWMIRNNDRGVDFGLWREIPVASLMIPLDLHTGNMARKLGLLIQKQNNWTAVEELTATLRQFDPEDPIKYDFALFGMGAYE